MKPPTFSLKDKTQLTQMNISDRGPQVKALQAAISSPSALTMTSMVSSREGPKLNNHWQKACASDVSFMSIWSKRGLSTGVQSSTDLRISARPRGSSLAKQTRLAQPSVSAIRGRRPQESIFWNWTESNTNNSILSSRNKPSSPNQNRSIIWTLMRKSASQTRPRCHLTLIKCTKSPISKTKRSVSNGKKWVALVPEIKKNQNSLCLIIRFLKKKIMMEMIWTRELQWMPLMKRQIRGIRLRRPQPSRNRNIKKQVGWQTCKTTSWRLWIMSKLKI